MTRSSESALRWRTYPALIFTLLLLGLLHEGNVSFGWQGPPLDPTFTGAGQGAIPFPAPPIPLVDDFPVSGSSNLPALVATVPLAAAPLATSAELLQPEAAADLSAHEISSLLQRVEQLE